MRCGVHSRRLGCGLAVAVTCLAALLRWVLPGALAGTPYLAFYPAIAVAAAFGGLVPGLVATIGSALCVDLLFDSTPGWIDVGDPVVLERAFIFLAGGTGVSLIAGRFQTQRRRAEAAAREAREAGERLSATFQHAGVGLAEADTNDRFIAANDRACHILGYRRDELLGMTVHELTYPEDRPNSDRLNAELHEGRRDRIDYEKRYLKRDGRPLWVHVTVSPVRDEQGRWLRAIATIEDISERKAAEQALRDARHTAEQAQAAAEEASKAKDHFLAVLSHELRTPLTPVLATLELLQSEAHLDHETRQSLELIQRNAELEARLIDDLLDLTRIARGKIELNRRHVPLCEVILHAVEVCRTDLEARRLHFAIDMGEAAPYFVEADSARLQQVFWNLLKNAIKFTPQGGRVDVRCQPLNANQVIAEVSDNGSGIEPEALGRIFKPFEQATESITRHFGGLGLGLAISKALVEMHGGTIEAHSAGRGKGATFRLRLPLAGPAGKPVSAPVGEPSVGGKPPARPLNVLLVEDHGDTARIMSRLLARQGYRVKTAADVATAIELAVQQEFDLLVSDLGLPDRSGLDLIRELRSRGQRLPAIALSGYGQEEDVRRSHEAGFDAHLIKPVDFEQFYRTVARVAEG
jgi:two-component system CheB/CheR fusion protein